jgi:hemerythrin
MAWSDTYLLGFDAMDTTHREFVTCVAALQTASDDELPQRLAEFEHHALAHFDDEQRWMDGSAFPATACHAEEHAKVLASVREVIDLVAQGIDRQVARDLTQALVDWFPGHADHMDSALSHWLNQRQHGGAPVVIRRNVLNA